MMKYAAEKHVRRLLFIVISCLIVLFSVPAHASSVIDVGLTVSQFSAELVAPSSFVAIEPDGEKAAFEKGKYFIAADQGKIKLGDRLLVSGTVLEIGEQEDKNETSAVSPRRHFTVNRQEYRGTLILFLTNDGKSLTVVNRVPMEYYVNSVLGPKSSPIWPDEAIKAQAVAVRSLAWYYKHNPESNLFDVRASEPEAFYGGIRNENKNITKVAAQTFGQVLYFSGSPAMTYTCESSGGRTVSASEALQKDIPYLQAVEDYDTDCPSFTWEKKIQAVTISRLLDQGGHKLGRLRGYRISDSEKPDQKDRYPSGRVKTIYWQGELGSVTMTGQELADMLALSSNWFDVYVTDPVPQKLDVPIENGYGIEVGKKQIPIEIKGREKDSWKSVIPGYHFLEGTAEETILFKGKGIGRGLGLSKWGAKGMADAAPENAENYYKTILKHYYPETDLVSAY
ncbi:MAG: SpoIID/LytB domain-containing protein [Acidaminococcaceae bacterium]|nr:SpoIID/LytB domain-containing protein [Acidaminococcaceae bacterium]